MKTRDELDFLSIVETKEPSVASSLDAAIYARIPCEVFGRDKLLMRPIDEVVRFYAEYALAHAPTLAEAAKILGIGELCNGTLKP